MTKQIFELTELPETWVAGPGRAHQYQNRAGIKRSGLDCKNLGRSTSNGGSEPARSYLYRLCG